jgi:hypothetical protein
MGPTGAIQMAPRFTLPSSPTGEDGLRLFSDRVVVTRQSGTSLIAYGLKGPPAISMPN